MVVLADEHRLRLSPEQPDQNSQLDTGRLHGRISGCLEEVPTLLWLEEIADTAGGPPERLDSSGLGLAQVCFDLGKGLLDRVAMMPLNDCFLLTFSRMT
jgi:hypothetical protein